MSRNEYNSGRHRDTLLHLYLTQLIKMKAATTDLQETCDGEITRLCSRAEMQLGNSGKTNKLAHFAPGLISLPGFILDDATVSVPLKWEAESLLFLLLALL